MHGPTAPGSIPPIEIGSFVAHPPEDSEFIGSASGAFFTNTVFRAFSELAPVDASELPGPGRESHDRSPHTSAPGPESAHTYLVAAESTASEQPLPSDRETPSSAWTYHVDAPSIGLPPRPDTAKKLLMLYFQHWHPFFPFLHGPTFFEQINQFYDEKIVSVSDHPGVHSPSKSLCRAILFQSVFNIAALSSGESLDPVFQIQSPAALTACLGTLFCNHDITSIQALFAAELYLTMTMSLRAASSVHGMLTRVLYSAGFHRCPSRYVQLLPFNDSSLRKRIFWSAYILDRYISQALGHPCSIQDMDVDVCIPGMAELHKMIPSRVAVPTSTLNEEAVDHLPTDFADSNATAVHSNGTDDTEANGLPTPSSASHSAAARREATEHVLGHLVTWSRLVGEAVVLFHRSVHSRTISYENLQEMILRIQSWWNSLPVAFQDDATPGPPSSTRLSEETTSFASFFGILHSYLVLLVNRPFLSLPRDTLNFQSSLQATIGASRVIVTKLRSHIEHPFFMSWPGMLAAAWMSGLVLAFASLLKAYPFAKADSDIDKLIKILDTMGSRWTSARHCREALESLSRRLAKHVGSQGATQSIMAMPPLTFSTTQGVSRGLDAGTPAAGPTPGRGTKRGRAARDHDELPDSRPHPANIPGSQSFQELDWMPLPVVEYTGPDFGFDTTGLSGQALSSSNNLGDIDLSGIFSDFGWDAYMQGFGNQFG